MPLIPDSIQMPDLPKLPWKKDEPKHPHKSTKREQYPTNTSRAPQASITNLLADIKDRGIAKTNRFAMLVPAPVGMPEIKGVVTPEYWSQFSIESTQLPGFNISTQENFIQHITQKMPYMVNFDEIQMSIRCDGLYSERKFFEAWKNLMRSQQTGNMRYKRDYTVDLYIEQLDDNGNTIYGVIILNAYPIQLGDLDLQSQSTDFHHMNVSFAYDKYITYDDMDWTAVFKQLDLSDSAKDYKKYQNRGPSPMELLRHASNFSNYARDTVRNVIADVLPVSL